MPSLGMVLFRLFQKRSLHIRHCLVRPSASYHPTSSALLPPIIENNNNDEQRQHGSYSRSRRLMANCLLSGAGFVTYAAFMDPPRRARRNNKPSNSAKEEKLFEAIRFNNVEDIKQLLAAGDIDVNCRHQLGWTPIHLAAVSGNVDTVAALLAAGADPNVSDTFSNIYEKADELGMSSLDVMLWRDADFSDRYRLNTNRTTFRGCTPLHYAVNINSPKIVTMLLEAGADPTIENEMGYRPSDYATDESLHDHLLECEEKYEAQREEREAAERVRYPLERRLRDSLVGQEAAIRTVSAAIRRWQSGWADDEHPLVMLFLGSSGIGKTELAKQVAVYLSKSSKDSKESPKSSDPGNSKGFIRLDMSEYQERHSVARLIGSPPGYIGHDEGGQLTSKLSASPNAVVLFDEIEKAHPDVLTVLLQLFDEGRLTDGKGKTIVCTKAIFIMTSNLASEEIAAYSQPLRDEVDGHQHFDQGDQADSGEPPQPVWVSKRFKENVIRPILKDHFKRDEFLGRINEFVYFLPFSRRELMQLVAKELGIWKDRASKRHGISLTWDRSALDILADGYNIHYGARSIKYEVERQVIDRLAAAHDLRLIGQNSVVRILGDKKINTTTSDSSLAQPNPSASRQFERSIRLQVKKASISGSKNNDDAFEDLDDSLLLEAIERAVGKQKRT